ncbi:hypothetical protein [Acidicapsa ligni]|uniref:hypothetical protein n=1 Tax=Acidicapsa ligni TaxID=542300 RepID=UPI0021E0347E|nr:hypothetical protein [Acidicapsa ligni]
MVRELWKTKARPSFYQPDGERRRRDIAKQLVPVVFEGRDRNLIYPGRDARVIRIIKKIIRGLSYYHNVEHGLEEERIEVEVLTYPVPDNFWDSGTFYHCELDICLYWHQKHDDVDLSSVWVLNFFEQRKFIVRVRAPSKV